MYISVFLKEEIASIAKSIATRVISFTQDVLAAFLPADNANNKWRNAHDSFEVRLNLQRGALRAHQSSTMPGNLGHASRLIQFLKILTLRLTPLPLVTRSL